MPRTNGRGQHDGLSALAPVLGAHFLNKLNDPNPEHHPLKIGTETWSRYEAAKEIGISNMRAAHLLSIAADEIGAKNVKDLYNRSTPYSFATTHGFGETCLYVAFELFRSQGLDPVKWYNAGIREAEKVVIFRSLKEREQKHEKIARDDEKRQRRRARKEDHKQNLRAEKLAS